MPHEVLRPDSFIHHLKAESREQVLERLAWKIGRETRADMTWVAEQLLLCEQRETSGIGEGVAIPHLKSTPLEKPHIVLATLSQGIDFGALDNEPVDIVCAVLSPRLDGALHLRRLSRMTRLLRESFLLQKLRAAASESELEKLFSGSPASAAAA